MALKQTLNSLHAPDGSYYVTLTDGAGNLGGTAAGSAFSTPPTGVTVLHSSSGNVAAAVATATLTGAAAVTTYISGLSITGSGATAGSVVTGTVTGLTGGTMSITVPVVTGVTAGNTPIQIYFDPPLAASAANTNIVVSVPSLGAGNTNSTVSAWGYRTA
jgi:hypothetical protein